MNRKRTTPSHNVLPQKKRNVSIPIVLTLEQQYVQRKKKKKKKKKEKNRLFVVHRGSNQIR